VDAEKVAKLNRGESYIRHIPSGRVAELLRTERFRATADPAVFEQVDRRCHLRADPAHRGA